jgi:hypothetical protein
LATNSVEQGALFTPTPGCDEEEPTGDASAGDGKKCGNDAWIEVRAAVGCGMDSGCCTTQKQSQSVAARASQYLLVPTTHTVEGHYWPSTVCIYIYISPYLLWPVRNTMKKQNLKGLGAKRK